MYPMERPEPEQQEATLQQTSLQKQTQSKFWKTRINHHISKMMPSVNSGYGNGANQWMLIVKIPKGDGKYKNTGKQRIMQLSKLYPKSKNQVFPKFERYSIQIHQCSTSIPYAFSPLYFHLFSSVCPRCLKDKFCFFGSLKDPFLPAPLHIQLEVPPPPPQSLQHFHLPGFVGLSCCL